MDSFTLPYINRQNKLKILAPLLNHTGAVLLDSGGKDNEFNRFDIFCCQPEIKLTFDEGNTRIVPQSFESNFDLTDPLDCLRKLLKQFQPQNKIDNSIPFNGGWLGYISYDFGRYLETLPALADDDIQLPQINMGLYRWALINDHKNQTSHLYNFALDANKWKSLVEVISSSLDFELKNAAPAFSLTNNWQSNTCEATYDSAFNKIQDYIHAGDCYQVNYSQRFCADYSGNTFTAYQQLSNANQAPFSAYMNFGDHQILCLSPERFIQSSKNQVTTQPIKGTRPRSDEPVKDVALKDELINSEKDRAENLMIVDLLRNDLSRTAAKASVKVDELFGQYAFESVHHLISTVSSKLAPQFDNFDLLATTLPGGSITGAPKIRAMQIIEELEPVRRNLYCGIIGYMDFNGNMDTNICIRTLIAKDKQLYCWAGGGLVADSQAKEEYLETFDKLAKILPVLTQT